jgi:AraC-like DNA-binding protein
MEQFIHFKTIEDYHGLIKKETLHPLVSIIDFSKVTTKPSFEANSVKFNYGLYCIVLKDVKCGDIRYGKHTYDYQDGTLLFTSPGQVISVDFTPEEYKPKGFALLFHPDLIYGTTLGKNMHEYSFFSYQSNEALHLSKKERKLVIDCFKRIQNLLEQSIDKHSKRLLVSNIELFLNYCVKFYERQFFTRDTALIGSLEKFEFLLNEYFQQNKGSQYGIPSVAYFAGQLNLSIGYFGDLIKKQTGKTAKEYIQDKMIDWAKERIFDPSKSINQIAYELGFTYPQHFTRLFKQKVGQTPKLYRCSLN